MNNDYLAMLALAGASLMGVQPVLADDVPLRGQRREVFRMLPVDKETIVFVGNSITHFGVWPEMFGRDVKVVNRGISGNLSGEVADHLDFILDGQPKKLFVMIGINDNKTPEVIVPNIRRIIETAKRESPETEVYVQSLLPCNRDDRHGMVEPKNEELKQLCAELEVPYIDVYSKIVDNSTNPPRIAPEYTNDWLHVIGPGYRQWISGFSQYVGTPSVFEAGDVEQPSALDNVENMLLTQFQLLPVLDGDMLHIGDYNVKTGEWAELMNDTHFLNRGMGLGWGYQHTITDLMTSVPYIVKGKPSKIFVQCGARDWGNTTTTTEWAKTNYKLAIDKIMELAPGAEVYMESTIPFVDKATNDRMADFHAWMKEWADSDPDDKLYFADVYGALVDANGQLDTKYRGANTNQSKGINGRGYLRWANCLNDASGKTMFPRPELTDAQFTLSEAIAQGLRNKYALKTGDTPGCYSQEVIDLVAQAVTDAKAVLAKADATDEEMANAAAAITSALDGMGDAIVMPKLSTEGNEVWYKVYTPQRNAKYLENAGIGQGAVGAAANNYRKQQWKFVQRTDGFWDIINRADGSYLCPNDGGTAPILTTEAQPAKGWKLTGVKSTGLFIVTNGGIQLHMLGGNTFVNWGGGNRMDDAGCVMQVIPVVGEPDEDPLPEPAPAPIAALTDVELTGTAPVEIPAEVTSTVLAEESVTVAIDFTLSQNPSNSSIVASTNNGADNQFLSLILSDNIHMAMRFNTSTGVYTRETKAIGTDRHQIVATIQPTNPSYSYYIDGSYVNNIPAASKTFGTVDGVNAMYLGGVVTASNPNLYPAKGIIHSVQFFSGLLTAQQIADIDYENVSTSIGGIATDLVVDGHEQVYDLNGRLVNHQDKMTSGVYVVKQGAKTQKVVVK